MIKINVVDYSKLENDHWKWFNEKMLKNWLTRIHRDKVLQILFFGNESNYQDWRGSDHKRSTKKWFEAQSPEKFSIFKSIVLCKPHNIRQEAVQYKDNLKLASCYGAKAVKKATDYLIGQYEVFREERGEWLHSLLDLKSCPYCNRAYVGKTKNIKNKKRFTFQIDHFISKIENPAYCLSIYNLIPCCPTCNSIKSDEDKEILNPYFTSFGYEGVFKYRETKELIEILMGIDREVEVCFHSSKQEIENAISLFGLEELYENHSSESKELLIKKIVYSDSKINDLISNSLKSLGLTNTSLKALLFSHFENDSRHHMKLLSKFHDDLYKHLDCLNI